MGYFRKTSNYFHFELNIKQSLNYTHEAFGLGTSVPIIDICFQLMLPYKQFSL